MTRHHPRITAALALAATLTGCPGSNIPEPPVGPTIGKDGCVEIGGKKLCGASPSPTPTATPSPTLAPTAAPTDAPSPTPTTAPTPTPTPPIIDPSELLTTAKVGSRFEFRLASLVFGNPNPDKKLDTSSGGYAFWLGLNRLGYSATVSIPCSLVGLTISCDGSRPGGPAIQSGDAGNVFAIKIASPPAMQSLQPEGWMILRASVNLTPGSVTVRSDPVATGSLQLFFP